MRQTADVGTPVSLRAIVAKHRLVAIPVDQTES